MSAARVPERRSDGSTQRIRADLVYALASIKEGSLIFTKAEVDAIAEALGGYTRLQEVLDGVE